MSGTPDLKTGGIGLSPPTLPQRTRKNGAPLILCDLGVRLVGTFASMFARIEWAQENRRLKFEICRRHGNFFAIHQEHIEL
jgi:hypothetical protein